MASSEGNYTYRLSPLHGWGRWVRLFENNSFEVKAWGEKLRISGVYPDGNGEQKEKIFTPIEEGVFQEQGGRQHVWFHRYNGEWKLTGIDGATLDATPFRERPQTLFAIYAGVGLLWIVLLIVWLIRYAIRRFSSRKKEISGHVGIIAAMFTLYLPVQLLYGLTQMNYGYPGWYRWGICSLPLLAAAVAVHMLWKNLHGAFKGSLPAIAKCSLSLIALGFTVYLGYWNMLSIHYY